MGHFVYRTLEPYSKMQILTGALVTFLVASCSADWPWAVKTVDKLDINKYLGRWYEATSSYIPKKTFQKNSFCTNAIYSLRKDGKIGVLNSGRLLSPTGKENSIKGYAYVVDPKFPGKLKVAFPSASEGNYWVVKLGPLNSDGKYSYAVVTSNFKLITWVLVRDVDEYKTKYYHEVQTFLKKNGYDRFYNRPKPTYQGKDCIYNKME